MKSGLEIRWHGRGGQGAKTAALLLADVAFKTGQYVQGFPEYGPERMGAPITAYNRISKDVIRVHSNIYTPDLVVVVDLIVVFVGMYHIEVSGGYLHSLISNNDLPASACEISYLIKGMIVCRSYAFLAHGVNILVGTNADLYIFYVYHRFNKIRFFRKSHKQLSSLDRSLQAYFSI